MNYLHERRAALGGYMPSRRAKGKPLTIPPLETFKALLEGSGERDMSTTMAFVRFLTSLTRDKAIGKFLLAGVATDGRALWLRLQVDGEDFFIARRAYEHLAGQDLDAGTQRRVNAFRERNRDRSGGDLEAGKRQYLLRTIGRFEDLEATLALRLEQAADQVLADITVSAGHQGDAPRDASHANGPPRSTAPGPRRCR